MDVRSFLIVLGVVGFGGLGTPKASAEERSSVAIDVRHVFGPDLLLRERYVALEITATNRTRLAFRGDVVVETDPWVDSRRAYRVRLDLPPRARRSAQVTVYMNTDARVRYVVDAESRGEALVSGNWQNAAEGVVTWGDATLRRGLLDLKLEQSASPSGGPRIVGVPVAMVYDDSAGEVVLPRSAAGWSSVGLFVVSGARLHRLDAAEREALLDWIKSGGSMLVFPRTDGDYRDPVLRSWVGDLRATPLPAWPSPLRPAAAPPVALRGDRQFVPESFGGFKRVGLGRIWVATFDGFEPQYASARETRDLVLSILHRRTRPDEPVAIFPFGRGDDSVEASFYGGFGELRSVLDPNESYRFVLLVVALLLVVYTVVVGPVNFAIVARRNRPLLALATTPIAALSCLLVMLGVGCMSKGVRMRYRRVEVVETVDGALSGSARRYTGLFFTRPADVELVGPEHGALRVLGGRARDHHVERTRERVRGLRGRWWDTAFVREERVAELGGPIEFGYDLSHSNAVARMVSVTNRTNRTIESSVVFAPGGCVYRVGRIPKGGIADVGRTPITCGQANDAGFRATKAEERSRKIGLRLKLDPEILDGVHAASNYRMFGVPAGYTLVAMLAPEGERIAATFDAQTDVRMLRVMSKPAEVLLAPVTEGTSSEVAR